MLSALLLLITLFQSVLGYNNTQVKLKSCVLDVLGNNAAQRIVVPADATYTDARLGEAIQFKELPTLIAYAEKVPEVQGLVKCAKSAGVKAVPRSGGHHFLGYSVLTDTLVIDVTHIDDVHISEDLATVRAGGGIRLGALYTALDLHNKTFPGGICPTVGLSGYLGSGGFSGIIVDWTLKTIEFPRSAMLLLTWNGTDAHFPVAQRFLEWAPTAPKAFTSQINVYKSQVQILGWYLGGTAAQLRTLVQGSGILNIGHPQIIISDGCNTDNARVFGTSINECLPDDEAKQYSSALNPFQQAFAAFGNATQFKYQESTQNADIPAADPWPRFRRKSKSFFLQKGKPLEDDILREVITRIEQLDEASQIWAEWHAWNLSSESTDFSFPWASQAKAHLEFQIHGSEDAVVQEGYDKWFTDLEHLLRPAVG
ncbi:hypothetical protein F5Y08DRAFT_304565 [Xylaria arbuscula]|nr:hypothetical protein F5Y08DRAFT_304565 [Xylaria arbuscula]